MVLQHALAFAPSTVQTSHKKILILAEGSLVRHNFKNILHKEGYTVHVVSSIGQAMAVFSKFHPDIVISDIFVPGKYDSVVDGITFIEFVKQAAPKTITILMSATATNAFHPSGLPAADATLSTQSDEHPYAQLLHIIHVLDRRQHEQQIEGTIEGARP